MTCIPPQSAVVGHVTEPTMDFVPAIVMHGIISAAALPSKHKEVVADIVHTTDFHSQTTSVHRLAGLVVKASSSGAKDPGLESRLGRDFSGSSHTSDLKIGTPVATLPGAWDWWARCQYTVTG